MKYEPKVGILYWNYKDAEIGVTTLFGMFGFVRKSFAYRNEVIFYKISQPC